VVGLLFNMQIPQLISMQPQLEQLPDVNPGLPRLTLMQYALNPTCDTDLLSNLLDLFKQQKDEEGAAACVMTALGGTWEENHDFT
jgi:hypothetical protein